MLTARHCDLPTVVVVRFPDRSVSARRVYVTPAADGPVAYDCDGEGYPFAPVAERVPARCETVWSCGYPDLGGRRALRWASGPLLGGGEFQYRGGTFRGNRARFVTLPGWSGGPLFNRRGEVCGLLSCGDDESSVFISFAAVREAWLTCQARSTNKPTLYVFGSTKCGPCVAFKRDYADDAELRRRLDERFTVVFVDVDRNPETARQFGIEQVPAFVVPGQPAVTGYEGAGELLQRLGLVQNETSEIAESTSPAESSPETEPSGEPAPAVEPPASRPAEPTVVEKPPIDSAPSGEPLVDPIDRLSRLVQTAVSVATWLGVGGLTGGAGGLILGGLALWRTLRRRRDPKPARDPPSNVIPPPVVTIENPPPPQAIVPETRFAPYERDTFAEAFAWAESELVRKYPGAVSTLEALKGLINQFLSAKGVKPTK